FNESTRSRGRQTDMGFAGTRAAPGARPEHGLFGRTAAFRRMACPSYFIAGMREIRISGPFPARSGLTGIRESLIVTLSLKSVYASKRTRVEAKKEGARNRSVRELIVVTKNSVTDERIGEIVAFIEKHGVKAHVSRGTDRTVIGIIGKADPVLAEQLRSMKGVEDVIRISKSYKLASRDFHPENTVIEIKGLRIGGDELVVMGGPCAVESPEQIDKIAYLVKAAGGQVLRGGAFKPRTGPYSFQGIGVEGLKWMREAADRYGLLTITEVMTPEYVEICARYSDMLQVGTRNMQNFDLLRKLGT